MTKIASDKAQVLSDRQFKLSIGPVNITDDVIARAATSESVISGNSARPPFDSFIFKTPEIGAFNLDLSEAPENITKIDVLIKTQTTNFRSWSLTGLSSREFWQNDGFSVPEGATCLLLSFTKVNQSSWTVTAVNRLEGEDFESVENSELPDDLRSLAAQARAKGICAGARQFGILLDTTESMSGTLTSNLLIDVLTVIRSISAANSNKPVALSLGGVSNGSLGVLDDAVKKFHYLLQISKTEAQRKNTLPLSESLENSVMQFQDRTVLYVITDSIPWIDLEGISRKLESTESKLFIVLVNSQRAIEVKGLPSSLFVIRLDERLDTEPKTVLKKFE